MLRATVFAVVTALASAASHGDEPNAFDLKADLSIAQEQLMMLQGGADDYAKAKSAIEEMQSTTQSTVTALSGDITAALAANNNLRAEISKMHSTVIAAQANVDVTIKNIYNSIDDAVDITETKLDELTATIKSDITDSVSQWTSDAKSDAQEKSDEMLSSLMGSTDFMSTHRHVFSGRASDWGGRGGWRDFRCDIVEIDTARPWFYKRTDYRFQAIKDGVYHLMWFAIQHGGRCHSHNRVRTGNGNWIHEHSHKWLTDGNWEGASLNMNWKFLAGMDFWTIHYNSCGNRWHAGPSDVNNANSYNRIFIEYIGQVVDDNGNQVTWRQRT